MTEEDEGLVSSIHERAVATRGTIESAVDDIGSDVANGIDDAVTVVDDSVDSASQFVDGMGQGAFNVLQTVVDVLEDYISENDFNIQISEHQIRVTGDEDGLRKVETDLHEALKGQDVHIDYDRQGGLSIEFNNSNNSK